MKLSTSNQVMLSNAARKKGGGDKFSFFEIDEKVGSNIKTVQLVPMVYTFVQKLCQLFDMHNHVLQIIPAETGVSLKVRLNELILYEQEVDKNEAYLISKTDNATLLPKKFSKTAFHSVLQSRWSHQHCSRRSTQRIQGCQCRTNKPAKSLLRRVRS